MVRIAINGFGRIGRAVTRLAAQKGAQVVAINDLMDTKMMAYLLANDSVHGPFDDVKYIDEEHLQISGQVVKISHAPHPSKTSFKDIDVVIESTGKFLTSSDARAHLKGAQKVIISAPAKDETPHYVLGVNHDSYRGEAIISNASCTTNCLAPVVKILDAALGIQKGVMTTIHSYTIDQNLLDSDHRRDIRRSRAAAVNIVPTTTGAAKAIGKVLPSLDGKLHGRSVRVPVADVSMMDLNLVVSKKTTQEEVNILLEEASQRELKGILGIDTAYRVSSDFLNCPLSSVVAADLTQVVDRNLVKVMCWYDNEWGYANRLLEMAHYIMKGE